MDDQETLYEVRDGAAWVTINRPEVRNAFREQTLDELRHALASTRRDPTIAAAVISGADGHFSAGGDFHAMMRLNKASSAMWNDRMLGVAMTIRNLPIPVIAMVEGSCVGGGHELMLWHDTGLHMLANVAANHLVSGDEPGRYGNGHPNIVPYRTYRTADGELAIAVGNDRQFRAFAATVGHPDWADDARFATNPARVRNRDVLDAAIAEAIRARTRSAWIARLEPIGIPAGPINLVSEALSSPHTLARDMVVELEHPLAGTVRHLGLPLRFSRTACSIRKPAPTLGEDTGAVLADLGTRTATSSHSIVVASSERIGSGRWRG